LGLPEEEGVTMDEVLTRAEIEARFPSEWVLLADTQHDEHLRVLGGRVLCHSKDRDEVYDKAVELKPKSGAVLYTGKIPIQGDGFLL
jgi:hypothetical protein